MEKKEVYKLYQNWSKRVEPENPVDIIALICEITDIDIEIEQKLYAIGLILDKNKEHYIAELKRKLKMSEAKIKTLENNYQALKQKQENKKVKIVIRRGDK